MAKYFEFNKNEIVFGEYTNNNRTAISIVNPMEGPMCKCTVNIPDVKLEDDEVLIKDYSENEGVLGDLINAKVISSSIEQIPTGHVYVHKCKLLWEK